MSIVLADKVFPEIAAWGDELTAIRREIHSYPELGFDTAVTVSRIVTLLKKWGIEKIDTDIVKGGVIVEIDGNRPGKTVALRADIDALPMNDCSDNSWKSTIEARAHACGHDGHQTWLMAALRYLNLKRDFPGRVIGIFQPAEELAQGALAVIKAGVLEKYGIAEIYGAHTEPMLDKGVFGFRVGPLQASSDSFWVTVHGVGTHGGRPHLGVDPIPVGAAIISQLQTLVSRRLNPVETGVVSICSVNAGRFETANVIPHQLTLSGTVRTFLPEVRAMFEEKLKKIVTLTAQANDCTADINYVHQCSAVINAEEQTRAGIDAATKLYGPEHVVPEMTPFMSSEDFSEYQARIPGAIMRVGVRDTNHTATLHSQAFDFNDEVLPAAATLIAQIALSRLNALA